jgi:hypothetical protein
LLPTDEERYTEKENAWGSDGPAAKKREEKETTRNQRKIQSGR